MLDHITDLLKRSECSDHTNDEVIRRILLYGGDSLTVVQQFGISDIYTINNWINGYKKQVQKNAENFAPYEKEEKDDLEALQKRNKELEKASKEANLMILALRHNDPPCGKELKYSN